MQQTLFAVFSRQLLEDNLSLKNTLNPDVNLDKEGKMIAEPFAPITPTASQLLSEANPTTYKLWILLRQQHRPGSKFRFSAQEVAEELNRSENWVRKSLRALIDMGMVELLNQWFKGIYELRIIFQEGQSTGAQGDAHKSDQTIAKTSIKSPSNPDALVPNNQRFKEKHGTVENDQRKLYSIEADSFNEILSSDFLDDREFIWREVKAIAPAFNRKSFITLFSHYGEERIRKAIEAIREQKEKGNLRNVERSLYTAIKKGFRRNQTIDDRSLMEYASSKSCINRQPQAFELTQHLDSLCVKPLSHKDQLTPATASMQKTELGRLEPSPAMIDVSCQLAEVSALIMLLNWDKTQVRAELKKRYKTEYPMDLTIPQIKDWLKYLSKVHDRSNSQGGMVKGARTVDECSKCNYS